MQPIPNYGALVPRTTSEITPGEMMFNTFFMGGLVVAAIQLNREDLNLAERSCMAGMSFVACVLMGIAMCIFMNSEKY